MAAPRSAAAARGARRRVPRIAVIMAGGHGTRFWPRSRRRVPKQLLRLTGRRSLLQETVRRLRPLVSYRHMLVVTNTEHAAEVRRQLPALPPHQVLVEPVGRNTLPCIALAAEWIATRLPDATMIVLPADHVVKDTAGFRRSIADACTLAESKDCLVTFGVRPTRPETGYGYIEVGAAIDRKAHWVRRFREKPSAAVATRFIRSRRFLWNAGIFVWRTPVFDAALERHAPALRAALHGVWSTGAVRQPTPRLRRVYRGLSAVSVDVALMEPAANRRAAAPRVAVMPARFDWSDVGSWGAIPEVWGCDAAGNAVLGRVVPIDAGDSIVYSPDRLVALVGVKDLIVVDSHDALLICARDRAQDVRKVTEALRARGWSRYL